MDWCLDPDGDQAFEFDALMRQLLMRDVAIGRGRQTEYWLRRRNLTAPRPSQLHGQTLDGMDRLTYSAVQYITGEIERMEPNRKAVAFQNNPIMAHHFPHLDPRNFNSVSAGRGPVLPLDRQLLVSFLRRWTPEARERHFHNFPSMRQRFPEFAPPGGWPDRISRPMNFTESGPANCNNPQGPSGSERYQYGTNREPPYYDPGIEDFDLTEAPRSVRSRSPSPSRTASGDGTNAYYESPFLNQEAVYDRDQYSDHTRYGSWGDVDYGFIAGSPPDPIHSYHDLYPWEYPFSDLTRRAGYAACPIDPLVDPRGKIDYNFAMMREYPVSGPLDFAWDDSFTPAEQVVAAP